MGFLIAAAFVAAVAALGVALFALRQNRAPQLVGKTVVIHTRKPDDRTIRGVLHGAYGDLWTLRDAVLLVTGGFEQPLGGLEHVPVANIAFAQEVEAAV